MSAGTSIVLALLPTVLMTLVKVAGLVCAVIVLRQDRRAGGLALAGFAVLVVDNIINGAWFVFVVTRGLGASGSTPVLIGVELCQQLLFVVGFVLVVIAYRMRVAGPRTATAPPAPAAQPGPWTVPSTPETASGWPAPQAPDAPPAPGGWPAPQASDAPPGPGGWTPPGQGTDANNSGSNPGSGMSSSSG